MADEPETPQADAEAEASPAEDTTPAPAETEAAAPAEAEANAEAEAPASDEAPAGEDAPAAAAEGGDTPAPAEGEGEENRKLPEKKKDIFAELDPNDGEQPKVVKAKGSKNISTGIVHVSATFNNTIVSVTDRQGNVLGWSSSGKMGFRGSRKSTAYASQLVSQDACRQAMSHGLKEAEVRVKGPGSGREAAVRAVQNLGIDVTSIKDVTPIPHNGCRPPKARRV